MRKAFRETVRCAEAPLDVVRHLACVSPSLSHLACVTWPVFHLACAKNSHLACPHLACVSPNPGKNTG